MNAEDSNTYAIRTRKGGGDEWQGLIVRNDGAVIFTCHTTTKATALHLAQLQAKNLGLKAKTSKAA